MPEIHPVAPPPATVLAFRDPHVAWEQEWQTLLDWCNGPEPGARDLAEFPQWHRLHKFEALIIDTPARTLAGAAVQLRLARHYLPEHQTHERDLLTSALATLARLAGEDRA